MKRAKQMSVVAAGAPSADFVKDVEDVDAAAASEADVDVNEDDDNANDADNEEDENSGRPTLLPAAPVRDLARLLLPSVQLSTGSTGSDAQQRGCCTRGPRPTLMLFLASRTPSCTTATGTCCARRPFSSPRG